MLAEQVKNKQLFENTIETFKKENPSADIQLLEKTVGALYLVEQLVKEGLDFIFKGGTSLTILLNEIKRFSVDVDIITEENKEKIKDIINNIIGNQDLFTRFEENIRKNASSERMDLQHYKFFFNSVIDNSEKYILLDVAYESCKYPQIIEKRIENTKLHIQSDIFAKLPSMESILGDKLTVLAPETTGISYDSGKELEIVKQLYDVDKLFNEVKDINEVRESFIQIANRELVYRKLEEYTYESVLCDIENFAENIIFQKNREKINTIANGISKFSNFMLEKKFLMDREVLIAASKVLYLVNLIRTNQNIIDKYQSGQTIEEIDMPLEHRKRLKVIKRINEEAYFYITKTMELKEGVDIENCFT